MECCTLFGLQFAEIFQQKSNCMHEPKDFELMHALVFVAKSLTDQVTGDMLCKLSPIRVFSPIQMQDQGLKKVAQATQQD